MTLTPLRPQQPFDEMSLLTSNIIRPPRASDYYWHQSSEERGAYVTILQEGHILSLRICNGAPLFVSTGQLLAISDKALII